MSDFDRLRAECETLRDRELRAGREVSSLVELLKNAASTILGAAAGGEARRDDIAHAYRLVITAIDQAEGIDCDGNFIDSALAASLRLAEGCRPLRPSPGGT